MKANFSCIIPFKDEGVRPLRVLSKIVRIKLISQIICVDDGSQSDETYNLIKKNYPQIRLLKHATNKGKSAAVKTGLLAANEDNILLFDADRESFDYKIIESGLRIFGKKHVDMILFRNINIDTNPLERFIRSSVLNAGERILKRKDLLNVFKLFNPSRYQLEAATNQFMLERNKMVYFMNFKDRQVHKSEKWGKFKGWNIYFKMQFDILSAVGLYNWVKQYLYFCKEELIA